MTGLGAAAGGFMAWFKPESPRYVFWVHLGLVLTGGLAGACVGWQLGPIIYPEGLYRPGGSIYNAPPFYVAIVSASIGASGIPARSRNPPTILKIRIRIEGTA